MSDRMRPIPFDSLVNWVIEEYRLEKTIFGIPEKHFFRDETENRITFCGEELGSPLGPAAGPHTQLAQNLASAYLTGGRFFELKTVQILDRLTFPKPCINAEDECYNTEWSTELSIEEAFAEYVKGWFLIHLLGRELFNLDQRDFIFNMSVGYDLEGIKSEKVDRFIEGLKNASNSAIFRECSETLVQKKGLFKKIDQAYIESISPAICSSAALSTMHGCPYEEIETICKYLLLDKKLHLYVKLNPTLLGRQFVRKALDQAGYDYIKPVESSFDEDLRYEEAIPMLKRVITLAGESNRVFGVKLSNTLPVHITRAELTGGQMYMSGKPLFMLTINLADKLAAEFGGRLNISYSGGADRNNIAEIIATGIYPVTVATTLLKPGGYQRLKALAEIISPQLGSDFSLIDLPGLKKLARESINKETFHKRRKEGPGKKQNKKLPLFDCRKICTTCSAICPNRANIRIQADHEKLRFTQQILHIDGMCNECGNCATFCPYGGIPYREKLTLFWSREDFNSSQNNGFLLTGEEPHTAVQIRAGGEVYLVDLSTLKISGTETADPGLLSVIKTICSNYSYLFVG